VLRFAGDPRVGQSSFASGGEGDVDGAAETSEPGAIQAFLNCCEELRDPRLRWIAPLRLGNQVDLTSVQAM
jgi:hypothetical protein